MPAPEAGGGGGVPVVDLLMEDERWEAAGLPAFVEAAARAALRGTGRVPEHCEISLLACDDARIAALNAEFRGKPVATNVLSWPSFDDVPPAAGPSGDAVFLGDVALAYETCAREAAEAGLSLWDHATHLVVHGTLHLLGYDHEAEAEAEQMETLETKILAMLGVANPYSG